MSANQGDSLHSGTTQGGELASFKTPPAKNIAPVPEIGTKAPSSNLLRFPDGKLTIVVFLRHCGCPFAEKSFKNLTQLSEDHQNVHCIAVSHSSREATDRWIPQVGGTWNADMIVDEERDLYALWGLGVSSTWHAMSPTVIWSVYKLGTKEGIWNRTTESGTRWQTGGAFAVDRFGSVVWAHLDKSADDVPNLEEALEKLGVK